MVALREGLSLLMRKLSLRRSSKQVEEEVKMKNPSELQNDRCRDGDGKWRKVGVCLTSYQSKPIFQCGPRCACVNVGIFGQYTMRHSFDT